MHQMFGYGQAVQSAPFDHADKLLLMQIKGEQGLAWHYNIGCVLQLWISPEDLRDLRIDRIVTTLECD
jgi:hypothetical protein